MGRKQEYRCNCATFCKLPGGKKVAKSTYYAHARYRRPLSPTPEGFRNLNSVNFPGVEGAGMLGQAAPVANFLEGYPNLNFWDEPAQQHQTPILPQIEAHLQVDDDQDLPMDEVDEMDIDPGTPVLGTPEPEIVGERLLEEEEEGGDLGILDVWKKKKNSKKQKQEKKKKKKKP
ncbi:hypothetical protein SCHPADRAFT_173531 [Schizopora paradoxa]|uniref:Uncharacterized protein n=1 Tax=Schizopora paradoxa TaxID=27342 RepID=A0A0H2SJM8_9AGAM|nr:hypothetical protein SCHPADRAFT_173531 [Schizopora paradoxa]